MGSIKFQARLLRYIRKIRLDGDYDEKQWFIDAVNNVTNLYIKLRWISRVDNNLSQLVLLHNCIISVTEKMQDIIHNFLKDTDLRMFLLTHSVFIVGSNTSMDPLVSIMIEELQPTNEDINLFIHKQIDEEVGLALKKLSGFDPELVPYSVYPLFVIYKLYGNKMIGDSYRPVEVYDEDFLQPQNDVLTDEQVRAILEEYQPIDTIKYAEYSGENFVDDDLPF